MKDRPIGLLLFSAAGATLAASLALASLDAFEERIYATEVASFRALSSTIGRTLAWDSIVAFCGSPQFPYVGVAASGAAALWEAWGARLHHYGRHFGRLGVVAALAALVEQAADSASELVRRPAPWVVAGQPEFSQGLDRQELNFWETASVPDPHVTVWAFAIGALLRHVPRAAALSAVLLLAHGFALMTAGHQWAGSIWLSLLAGATVAGAWGMVSRRSSKWFERKSEQLFVRSFWRDFERALPGGGATEPKPVARSRRQRRDRREAAWDSLVQRRVLPLLAPGGGPAKLLKTPPVIGSKESRGSRYVRFLVLPDGQIVVVKHVRRPRGIFSAPSRIRHYVASARASLVLERLGMPVPRTFWMETSAPRLFGLWHRFFSVEEFISGRPLDVSNAGDTRAGMGLLARLHAHQAAGWGLVSESRTHSKSRYLLESMRPDVVGELDVIFRGGTGAANIARTAEAWKRFEDEFNRVIDAWPDLKFRMVHGDITHRNILFDSSDEPHLIDFVTVRYDLFAREVLKGVLCLTDGSRDAIRGAWLHYFESAPADRWEEFRLTGTLALALHLVREASKGRLRPRGHDAQPDEWAAWIALVFGSGPLWGASPADTDWEAILDLMRPAPTRVKDEGVA